MILFGDFYQLPHVPNTLHNDNGHYCFQSEIFTEETRHKFVLSEVFRQQEDLLIRAVRETALGGVSTEVDSFLKS